MGLRSRVLSFTLDRIKIKPHCKLVPRYCSYINREELYKQTKKYQQQQRSVDEARYRTALIIGACFFLTIHLEFLQLVGVWQ